MQFQFLWLETELCVRFVYYIQEFLEKFHVSTKFLVQSKNILHLHAYTCEIFYTSLSFGRKQAIHSNGFI